MAKRKFWLLDAPYRRILFCLNQNSYCLAYELAMRDSDAQTLIIYSPERVTPRDQDDRNIIRPYTRKYALFLFLKSIVSRPNEVCVPHDGVALLIALNRYLAKKCSLIDDGMDMFRTEPKNVVPHAHAVGTTIYTFHHRFPFAPWTSAFKLDRVCSFSALLKDARKEIPVEGVEEIVVESPGVSLKKDFNDQRHMMCVRHPNREKVGSLGGGLSSVSGREYSVEKTLRDFKGTLVVGESMVTIYALSTAERRFRLEVHFTKKIMDNIIVLKPVFEQESNCTLIVSEC